VVVQGEIILKIKRDLCDSVDVPRIGGYKEFFFKAPQANRFFKDGFLSEGSIDRTNNSVRIEVFYLQQDLIIITDFGIGSEFEFCDADIFFSFRDNDRFQSTMSSKQLLETDSGPVTNQVNPIFTLRFDKREGQIDRILNISRDIGWLNLFDDLFQMFFIF